MNDGIQEVTADHVMAKDEPARSAKQATKVHAKAHHALEAAVVILSNSKYLEWANFNKSALLKAVAKEPPEQRDLLLDEFEEKWNEGKKFWKNT